MRKFIASRGLFFAALCCGSAASLAADEAAPPHNAAVHNAPIPVAAISHSGPVDFEKEILPFFSTSCLACHNKTKAKAGLVLETPADILKGGDDGPAIVPGNSEKSVLLRAASHLPDIDSPMPPPNNKVAAPELTPEQLGLIKLWIEEGAKGEVHASQTPLKWQAIPSALDPIYAVAVSSDGRFAAAGRANRIDVYDIPSGKLAARLVDPSLTSAGADAAHRDMVESLAFNPDGTTLASGSYREIKLWRRSSAGQNIALGDKPCTALAATKDGGLIAAGGEDGIIRLFDGATAKAGGELAGHSDAIVALRFSADGRRLVSSARDKTLRVWNIADKKEFCQTETPDVVACLAWLGKSIAVPGADGTVGVWSCPSEADGDMHLDKTFKDASSPVTAIEPIPGDDANFLFAREDGNILRASLGNGSIKPLFKHEGGVVSMSLRADGKRLVSAGRDSSARLWSIEESKQIAELKGDLASIERVARADRAVLMAKNEINYRKNKMDAAEKAAKSAVERVAKAKNAIPAVEKGIVEARKAFDAAKSTVDAYDKERAARKELAAKKFAMAEDDLKKTKEARNSANNAVQKARDAGAESEKTLTEAQKAFDAAKTAKDSSDRDDDATDEEKDAAAGALEQAKDALQRAKDAHAAGPAKTQKANEELAARDREIASAQRALDAARGVKDAVANENNDKRDALTRELGKAEQELKKAQGTKSAAEDEIKLSARSAEETAGLAAEAKTILDAVQEKEKIREKEAADIKQSAGDASKPVRFVAFAPTGGLIVAAGEDGRVHVFTGDKGAPADTLGAEGPPLGALAFASDGRIIAAPVGSPPLEFVAGSSWKLDHTIGGNDSGSPFADRVTSLDFSADGALLAAGGGVPSRTGEVRIVDPTTGELKKSFDDVDSDTILCVRFNPDATRLACASADRFVRILDLSTGKAIRSLEGHAGHALAVAWSHDGHSLVSGGADDTLRFWDAETGERGKIILGFDKEVTAVTYVGDNNQAVAASGDGKVRLVKDDGNDVRNFSGPSDFMYSIAASTDGSVIVAGGQDGVLRAWDGASGQTTGTFGPVADKK